MEEQRDLVVFSDDEGNEFELEIVDYFDYEGQEYAVYSSIPRAVCGCGCGCECEDEECEGEHEHEHEHGSEVYIMKIVVNGEYEEFLPRTRTRWKPCPRSWKSALTPWKTKKTTTKRKKKSNPNSSGTKTHKPAAKNLPAGFLFLIILSLF